MSSFAKRMGKVATRLITKFDERSVRVQLLRDGGHYFDNTLGENVFLPDTETPITCLKVSGSIDTFKNSLIESGDVFLIMTNTTEPTSKDRIKMDDKTYAIVEILPINYTGDDLTISYGVHARGG